MLHVSVYHSAIHFISLHSKEELTGIVTQFIVEKRKRINQFFIGFSFRIGLDGADIRR